MIDSLFRTLEFTLSAAQAAKLPRNASYGYEYVDGCAVLCPRPRFQGASLDLERVLDVDSLRADWEGALSPGIAQPIEPDAPARAGPGTNPGLPSLARRAQRSRGFPRECHQPATEALEIRLIAALDWDQLAEPFASAFSRSAPFASLSDAERLQAASECLEATRSGSYGPFVESASFGARSQRWRQMIGAILITLAPWKEALGADDSPCRPHMSWIFVSQPYANRGIGTCLLRAAARALRDLGHRHLDSTILVGNQSSMLWHWRQGFELKG